MKYRVGSSVTTKSQLIMQINLSYDEFLSNNSGSTEPNCTRLRQSVNPNHQAIERHAAMTRLIATFVYVGYLKPAPGTWGSLAALPAAYLIALIGGWPLIILMAILAYFAGLWATRAETEGKANHDPSEIVIDEVVGQWIALLPVVIGAQRAGADLLTLWPGWIAAFVLFRLFDITKPSLVGWADRRDDAVGVMLDDVIAGIFAAIGVVGLAAIAHLVIL